MTQVLHCPRRSRGKLCRECDEMDRQEREVLGINTMTDPEAHRWVAVEHHVPKVALDVLAVVRDTRTGINTIKILRRSVVGTWYEQYNGGVAIAIVINDHYKVTHWQPLPEVPGG